MSATMDSRPPVQSYPSNGIHHDYRPDTQSGFSAHSSSTGQLQKEAESTPEKEKRKVFGKANPNAAMNELQPATVAYEKPTLSSLRSLSYNDQYGNPIVEPDRSNPTRPRWERPLETIRSFEAAIDSEFKSRQLLARGDTQSEVGSQAGYSSRRTSGYWGGGYDSARPQQQRYSTYSSQYGATPRDNYSEGSPRPGMRQQQRQQSDSALTRYNQQGPYGGGPVQPHSRDTIASGSASSAEPWASGTDPTNSENSSIDRTNRNSGGPNDMNYNDYGISSTNGANMNGNNGNQYRGGAPIAEDGPYGYTSYQGGANNYYNNAQDNIGLTPPSKQVAEPRRIISLSGNNGTDTSTYDSQYGSSGPTYPGARPPLQHQESTKRKSWLKRRLSGRN